MLSYQFDSPLQELGSPYKVIRTIGSNRSAMKRNISADESYQSNRDTFGMLWPLVLISIKHYKPVSHIQRFLGLHSSSVQYQGRSNQSQPRDDKQPGTLSVII